LYDILNDIIYKASILKGTPNLYNNSNVHTQRQSTTLTTPTLSTTTTSSLSSTTSLSTSSIGATPILANNNNINNININTNINPMENTMMSPEEIRYWEKVLLLIM
jgi:activator of HSP90 ATPase